MTQRGVESTRVHFWTFLLVSVNSHALKIIMKNFSAILTPILYLWFYVNCTDHKQKFYLNFRYIRKIDPFSVYLRNIYFLLYLTNYIPRKCFTHTWNRVQKESYCMMMVDNFKSTKTRSNYVDTRQFCFMESLVGQYLRNFWFFWCTFCIRRPRISGRHLSK